MPKVKGLEAKWFQYRAKKILVPLISISSLYLVSIGAYYLYENQDYRMTSVMGVSIESNESNAEMEVPLKTVTIKEKVVQEEIIKKETIKESKVIEKIALIPVIPVIDMEKEERISSVTKRHKPVKRIKHTKVKKTVSAKRNNYLTAKELGVITKSQKIDKVAPRKTKKMNFTSSSSNYLERIKHKFSKSNTPRDALLIAKTYYKNTEYTKSEKWALTANKLDNSLEDSWLLFAKSKAKLGKKKEALKILVSYQKKSHSLKAKRLIVKIRTGQI